jgi:sugar lactone lactonase YvrE
MHDTTGSRPLVRRFRPTVIALLAAALALAPAGPAAATRSDAVIVLPGASSAEGIAAGAGSTFYAGDLFRGDIFRGDVRRGTAALFIDAPDGRAAVGMAADLGHKLLFVAGGATGQGYVYSLRTGATVATYQLATTGFINDVAVTRGGAWFTDSLNATLYFVPVSRRGVPGPLRTLGLSGPAADLSGDFNLNGIQATPSGRTLIVAHSFHGKLYTVDPATGASAPIAGVDVPNVDGIVLDGRRLWAVQNFDNRVSRFRLSGDLSRGALEKVIVSPAFAIPTTAALFGHRLAVVNSHFDTGIPPTAPAYEVVVVGA